MKVSIPRTPETKLEASGTPEGFTCLWRLLCYDRNCDLVHMTFLCLFISYFYFSAFLFFFNSSSLLLPTHFPSPSYTRAQSRNPHGLQAARLLSMDFSRQEDWSGLPFPSYFTHSFLIETTGDPTPLSIEEGFVFKYRYFKISETEV